MREVRSARTAAGSGGLLITLASAAAVLLLLIFLLSEEPGTTLYHLFAGPFANRYYFGNLLNDAIPLILTGLGISFAFRAAMFNLGGEGQIYVGALAAAAAAFALPNLPWYIGIPLTLTAAVAAGAAVAGVSGICKYAWRTDELISSFLISKAVIYVVDAVITGVLQDPESNLLTTRPIARQYWFLRILPPSNLDISIAAAVLLAFLSYIYLFKTRQGYEMRMCGMNREFARYGGGDGRFFFFPLPMLISGALHGLAGAVSFMGTQHMLFKGFSAGMGWNGIAVALIARNNPAWVIPSALFFAYIEAGAKSAMIHSDVTFEIAHIVQAVIFFLVTAQVFGPRRERREGGV